MFQVFRSRIPQDAISLTSRLLEYTPSNRVPPLDACSYPFFDELRESNVRLPNGRDLPPLFNFSAEGIFDFFFTYKFICSLPKLVVEAIYSSSSEPGNLIFLPFRRGKYGDQDVFQIANYELPLLPLFLLWLYCPNAFISIANCFT